MSHCVKISILFIFIGVLGFGCKVSEEKIELWKGTVNGPKKLAGTVIDTNVDINLRADAAIALVEINAWDLYRAVFTKMEVEDGMRLIDEIVPRLADMIKVEDAKTKNGVSKLSVDAKDGLFMILDQARPKTKALIEEALIKWCKEDYNSRAMAGQYSIAKIVKKIGPQAAQALVPLIALAQPPLRYIAELIRSVDDAKAMEMASKQMASELLGNVSKISENHLVIAAIVGGEAVGDAMLTLATNPSLDATLQRFALRAFSQAVEKGAINPNSTHISRLFSMAESESYDQHQREETYYVIGQAGGKEALPRIKKLLTNDESFWRAVGFRCILRIDGENELNGALREIETSESEIAKEDVDELVSLIVAFPKLRLALRGLLSEDSVFVQGVAIGALGNLGTKDDIDALKALSKNRSRLPKQFVHKTLGEAVDAAIEAIEKRG